MVINQQSLYYLYLTRRRTCICLVEELQPELAVDLRDERAAAGRRAAVVPPHGDPARRARLLEALDRLADQLLLARRVHECVVNPAIAVRRSLVAALLARLRNLPAGGNVK